ASASGRPLIRLSFLAHSPTGFGYHPRKSVPTPDCATDLRRCRMNVRVLLLAAGLAGLTATAAADWPQWRGPNRDAKVTDFAAPQTWPKELKQKWKVTVGNGDSTPSLAGDKLYVFTR